eukprot:16449999-Heterocapsa_arctica.AAC.3
MVQQGTPTGQGMSVPAERSDRVEDIFWSPLGEHFTDYRSTTAEGNPEAQEHEDTLVLGHIAGCSQDAGTGGPEVGSMQGHTEEAHHEWTQVAQMEMDTAAIADEWISVFQQPAESEVPDLCLDEREHEWRSSGGGTPSRLDTDEDE